MKILLWIVIGIVISLIAIYIYICGYLYFNQHTLLYFPSSDPKLLASIRKDPTIREFRIQTDAGYSVWRASWSGDCMIFYVWGNADNTDKHFVGERTWWNNCIFASFNYRGYGESDGVADEKNMHEDAVRIFEDITTALQPKKIYVVGRSLGTNTAIHLSHMQKDRVDGLVLIAPYDSITHVAELHYPQFPVRYLIKDAFDSLPLVKDLAVDTLIFQASDDTVVPAVCTDTLVQSFTQVKPQVELLQNTNHNNIVMNPEFLEKIDNFLK